MSLNSEEGDADNDEEEEDGGPDMPDDLADLKVSAVAAVVDVACLAALADYSHVESRCFLSLARVSSFPFHAGNHRKFATITCIEQNCDD
jgi:hypothetical protein